MTASADPGDVSYTEISLELREPNKFEAPGAEIYRTQIVTIEAMSYTPAAIKQAYEVAAKVIAQSPPDDNGNPQTAPNRAMMKIDNGEIAEQPYINSLFERLKSKFRPSHVNEKSITGESLAALSQDFGDRNAEPGKLRSLLKRNGLKYTIAITRGFVAGRLALETIVASHGPQVAHDVWAIGAAAPTGIMSSLFCFLSKYYGAVITKPWVTARMADDPAGTLRQINKFNAPVRFRFRGKELGPNINPLSNLKFQIPEKYISGVERYAADSPVIKILGKDYLKLSPMAIGRKLALYWDQFFKSTVFLETPFVIISGMFLKAYREPYIHIDKANTTLWSMGLDIGHDILFEAIALAGHAMVGIMGAGAGQLFADQAIELYTQNRIHKLKAIHETDPTKLSAGKLEKKIKALENIKDTSMAVNSMFQVGIVAFMAQGYDWANSAIWAYFGTALALRAVTVVTGIETENIRFDKIAEEKAKARASANPVVEAAESVKKARRGKAKSCTASIAGDSAA